MPEIAAVMRVKNEARWIASVLRSVRPLCSQIVVFDDHSDDDTASICESLGATVIRSPFTGLDESRDKQYLLEYLRAQAVEWVLMIDGDELLSPKAIPVIREHIERGTVDGYQLQIFYLWDAPNQIRVDGVYGRMWRPSIFRIKPEFRFAKTRFGCNFHCGSVPIQLVGKTVRLEAAIFHLGYMDREDRLRKYRWYNERDPHNLTEDEYRHMVQGDIPDVPAEAVLRYAGPLKLEAVQ